MGSTARQSSELSITNPTDETRLHENIVLSVADLNASHLISKQVM